MQISMSKYLDFDINTDNSNSQIKEIANPKMQTPLSDNISDISTIINISSYNVKIEQQGIFSSLTNNNIKQINVPEISNKNMHLNLENKNELLLNKSKIAPKKPKVKTQSKHVSISTIIERTEAKKNIPSGLLKAIGKVESGLNPYAINYNGRGYFFNNKESALKFVNNLIRQGKTNFGIGCFQLHYPSHHNKFHSVSVMLDPAKNIEYAAKLLNRLYKEHGYNWTNAIKRYHSSDSYFNSKYYYKVIQKLGRAI